VAAYYDSWNSVSDICRYSSRSTSCSVKLTSLSSFDFEKTKFYGFNLQVFMGAGFLTRTTSTVPKPSLAPPVVLGDVTFVRRAAMFSAAT
jgi:hypothetical protein